VVESLQRFLWSLNFGSGGRFHFNFKIISLAGDDFGDFRYLSFGLGRLFAPCRFDLVADRVEDAAIVGQGLKPGKSSPRLVAHEMLEIETNLFDHFRDFRRAIFRIDNRRRLIRRRHWLGSDRQVGN